jgi:hypothetical protein
MSTRQQPGRALIYAALVIIGGVLATTLAQTQVLARLPLQKLLKKRTARGPNRQRRILFLGGAGLVFEIPGRHFDRCVPALWQPP